MGTNTKVRAAGVRDEKTGPVFMANHTSVMPGPLDHFESYLWRHGRVTVRIDHPLDSYEGNNSVLRHNGKPVRAWKRHDRGPLGLFWDFGHTIRAALRTKAPVAIGANNFDIYSLLTARWLRLAHKPRVIPSSMTGTVSAAGENGVQWAVASGVRSVCESGAHTSPVPS